MGNKRVLKVGIVSRIASIRFRGIEALVQRARGQRYSRCLARQEEKRTDGSIEKRTDGGIVALGKRRSRFGCLC